MHSGATDWAEAVCDVGDDSRGLVHAAGPHRLVVRTSRRGRDNPGSNPGEDRHCAGYSARGAQMTRRTAHRPLGLPAKGSASGNSASVMRAVRAPKSVARVAPRATARVALAGAPALRLCSHLQDPSNVSCLSLRSWPQPGHRVTVQVGLHLRPKGSLPELLWLRCRRCGSALIRRARPKYCACHCAAGLDTAIGS